MASVAPLSTAWQDDETAALLAAYFAMLSAESQKRPFVKAQFNREVQIATGRSRGSIEYKFCNVSAILAENGLRYVSGYQPRGHYQRSLAAHVLAYERSYSETLRSQQGDKLEKPADSLWSAATKLWNRATGGTNVAAKPGDQVEADWPSAPAPAGVDAACDWLRQALHSPSEPRLLFLVGGPGAGKSHASAVITADFAQNGNGNTGPANRTYKYRNAFSHLTVVNDATIPDGTSEIPLTEDILTAVDKKENLLACVNRGILVEESAELADSSRASGLRRGLAIIDWLEGRAAADTSDSSSLHVKEESNDGFIKSGGIYSGALRVGSVCAVYVDVCSLFEQHPEETFEPSKIEPEVFPVRFKPQRQRLLTERSFMELDTVPAARLLKSIREAFAGFSETSAGILNPITANIASIRSDSIISGILTLARSAEVTNAARMTYRDVWGLFSRVIIGDAPDFLKSDGLQKWILDNQPRGNDSKDDFDALRRLARLRFSEALFGSSDGTKLQPKHAVLRFMRPVDPMRDVIPGYINEPGDGWASPVLNAFEVDAMDVSPLETLLQEDSSRVMASAVTEFDVKIDHVYRSLLRSENISENVRHDAIRWYSGYLTRLYAVSSGVPAFGVQINMWLLARNRVGHALPDELKSMMTLIRPQRFPGTSDGTSLVPLYSSRTEPIIGQLEQPRLGVRYSNLHLETSLQGEDILLHLVEDGQRAGSLYLDFALIREAMACEEGNLGITDLIDSTSPRLERIRSSRLLSSRLNDAEYTVVMQQSDSQATLMGY